jgi:hypothetical protein
MSIERPITDVFSELLTDLIDFSFTDDYITHYLNIIEQNYSECHNIQGKNYETLLYDAITSMNINDFYIALAFSYMTQEFEPEDTMLFIIAFFMKLLSSNDYTYNFKEILQIPKIKYLLEFNLNEMIQDFQLKNNSNYIAYKVIYDRLKIENPYNIVLGILEEIYPNICSTRLNKPI